MKTLKSPVFTDLAELDLAYKKLKIQSMKQIGLPASLEARTEIRAEATVLYRVEDGAKVRRAIGPLSNLRSFISANPGEFVLTVTF